MRPALRAAAAVLLALTAGLPPAGAQPLAAADWVQVYEHALGPITFDRASVRRDADIVTLLSRTLLAEERPDGTKILEARFQYDCRARTSDLLSVAHLRSDGSVIASVVVAPAERLVEPIPPRSPNAAIADAVCG